MLPTLDVLDTVECERSLELKNIINFLMDNDIWFGEPILTSYFTATDSTGGEIIEMVHNVVLNNLRQDISNHGIMFGDDTPIRVYYSFITFLYSVGFYEDVDSILEIIDEEDDQCDAIIRLYEMITPNEVYDLNQYNMSCLDGVVDRIRTFLNEVPIIYDVTDKTKILETLKVLANYVSNNDSPISEWAMECMTYGVDLTKTPIIYMTEYSNIYGDADSELEFGELVVVCHLMAGVNYDALLQSCVDLVGELINNDANTVANVVGHIKNVINRVGHVSDFVSE